LSLTNIGLYLVIAFFISLLFTTLAANATVHGIVVNQINATNGQKYLSFIYALFVFILFNNLIGMIPYSFASTSHFIYRFSLSFIIVMGAIILGFQKHGLHFFSLFVPARCPLALLPLLVHI
jgi:F-type H+-transporting ATPase subunit a